ncbi:MAG: class I mannose-6-phosphate isomerase [bacterium]|nr:class I mannose-6-phosphate isomerase [Candidatus Colisoma equi]
MEIRFEKDVHTALWGHEEWLVCAHPSAPGRIVGGDGKTLRDICPDFPLLVKKICANQRLSVQVHPNDETAKTVGGEPKTEMWCVLKAGPIFAGFKPGVTKADVERAVADGTFEDLLVRFDAKPGECYFIPGGLVHAIGEGTSVYEVQQSSDTTFRLYDWGRVGADGKPRQLHVKEGLAAMDIALPPPVPSDSVKCPYFEFTKISSAVQPSTFNLQPSWRVVYDPKADDCFLLSPGGAAEIPSGAWVTAVSDFWYN